jgi:hypothetical protein
MGQPRPVSGVASLARCPAWPARCPRLTCVLLCCVAVPVGLLVLSSGSAGAKPSQPAKRHHHAHPSSSRPRHHVWRRHHRARRHRASGSSCGRCPVRLGRRLTAKRLSTARASRGGSTATSASRCRTTRSRNGATAVVWRAGPSFRVTCSSSRVWPRRHLHRPRRADPCSVQRRARSSGAAQWPARLELRRCAPAPPLSDI